MAEVAGAHAREWWAHLTIVQKWEVIWTPTEIRLMKSSRGGGLSNLSVLRHPCRNCLSKGFVYSDSALGCPSP